MSRPRAAASPPALSRTSFPQRVALFLAIALQLAWFAVLLWMAWRGG